MNNLTKRKGFWLLVAALILLSLLLLMAYIIKANGNKDRDAETATTEQTKPLQQHTAEQLESNETIEDLPYTADKFITGTENLPKSLQGTEVDGEIIINDKAELVPTQGLRRLFDYFLSALGEEDNQTIDARVEAYILNTTPQPAAKDTLQLYYQYQSYLKQVAELKKNDTKTDIDLNDIQQGIEGEVDIAAVEKQQQQIKQIREKLFDKQAATAFFKTEDQLYEYNKHMLKIAQDKSLSAEQKQQAKHKYLNKYLKKAPNSLTKKQIEQQANMDQLITRTEQMKERGADDKQLFAMRTELVGVEAAERLAKLDQHNQDFDRRFEQYQQQKLEILNSEDSKSSKKQQIEAIEQKLFSDTEQKRLTGYELYKNQTS